MKNMKMQKILLIGSQHGDELLGDKLIRRIKRYHPDLLKHAEFYLANPKAHRHKKRYVESDMNRSYLQKPVTYESRRAAMLLGKIKSGRYDLVLDLHTTTDKMEPCFIAAPELSKDVINFLKVSSAINKVVVMKHKVSQSSLIGNVSNAISVEVSIHSISKDFLEELIAAIDKFIHLKIPNIVEKEIFYVNVLLEKEKFTPSQFRKMKNFELFDNSFYPILIRSSSYKQYMTYRGFGASIKISKRF